VRSVTGAANVSYDWVRVLVALLSRIPFGELTFQNLKRTEQGFKYAHDIKRLWMFDSIIILRYFKLFLKVFLLLRGLTKKSGLHGPFNMSKLN
jgi:hypothetical protein